MMTSNTILQPVPNQGSPATSFACPQCDRVVTCMKGLRSHHTRIHGSPLPQSYGINRGAERHPSTLSFLDLLQKAKSENHLIRIIPRAIREQVACEYAKLLKAFNTNGDLISWQRLMCFPYIALRLPKHRIRTLSVTQIIRQNIGEWHNDGFTSLNNTETQRTNRHISQSDEQKRAHMAEQKLAEGDIRAAVRILATTDSFANNSQNTLRELQAKHPSEPNINNYPDPPEQRQPGDNWVKIPRSAIVNAVKSFASSSSAGIDGLRPRHILDMIDDRNPSCLSLTDELCTFIEKCINGTLPRYMIPIFYGACLTALETSLTPIRAIACGLALRRLAAKVALKHSRDRIVSILRPHQVGVCVPGGAEAAVHAVRAFMKQKEELRIVVKLDFQNAFNSIKRDLILRVSQDKVPELYPLIWQCYREPTKLAWQNNTCISSERGVQQGDPLGPALFSLGISELVDRMTSKLNVWYLDDGTLGGTLDTVLNDIQKVLDFANEGGVVLNTTKCEVTVLGGMGPEQALAKTRLLDLLPAAKFVEPDDLDLLGSPIGERQIPRALNAKKDLLHQICQRAALMHPQAALFLLRHSLGVPKVVYTLRSAPTYNYTADLNSMDDTCRDIISRIMNINVTTDVWNRISLPVGRGGWGVRGVHQLALPCYAGSLSQFGCLSESLLPDQERSEIIKERDKAMAVLRTTIDPMPLPEETNQRLLDSLRCDVVVRNIEESLPTARDNAIFSASRHPFSGKWLEALPSSHVGTMLDPTIFRMAAALRVGAPVCTPFNCSRCNAFVDSSGLHPLSCSQSQGRRSRHTEINKIIHRSLMKAGYPCILEPSGLCLDNQKRPDGQTIPHWSQGKNLVWDATVACTVATSYVNRSARESGWVAEHADSEKMNKYNELTTRFHVVPLAFETMGPVSCGTAKFIRDLSGKISSVTGDLREGTFLRQHLSLAVQRGNIASILGAMGSKSRILLMHMY